MSLFLNSIKNKALYPVEHGTLFSVHNTFTEVDRFPENRFTPLTEFMELLHCRPRQYLR